MVTTSEIQHTRLKGELPFQNFCLKLVRRYWNDDYAEVHGRSGQSQHGVDISGEDNRNGLGHAGMQCKASETDDPRQLTVEELLEEVEKAKKYVPKLGILIVAYDGDRDEKLQRKAQEITDAHKKDGLFRVVVWSWPDITKRAEDFADVIRDLLVTNQVPVAPALDPRRPGTTGLEKLQAEVNAVFANHISAEVAPDEGPGSDPAAEAALDIYRGQVRAGNGANFIAELQAFIAGLSPMASPRVRLRAYGNLAAAHIQAGDFESALIAFDEAAKSDPDSGNGYAYRARAALQRGDRTTAYAAAQKALSLDHKSQLAAGVLIDSAGDQLPTAELEALVGPLAKEGDIANSLAHRFARVDHDNEAGLRIARAIEKQDWLKDVAVGIAILSTFEENEDLRIGAPIPRSDELLLQEALDRLGRAWEQVAKRTDVRHWAFVAGNLASAYQSLHKTKEADALALQAYDLEPDNPSLSQRAVLSLMHRKDLDGAQRVADILAASGGADEKTLAASVAAMAGRWPDTGKWAQGAYDAAQTDAQKARAAELLILAEHNATGSPEAIEHASKLRAEFGPDISFEARIAELARRSGDNTLLEDARKRLQEFEGKVLAPLEHFELANALADDDQWAAAARHLEGLYALDRPSELLRRHLYYLYRAEDRTSARALYSSLSDHAKSAEVLRLGAAIYDRSGMLKEARAELETAVRSDPNDLRSRLDWVRILLRLGDEKAISRWAKRAADGFEKADPEDVLELAQVLDQFGSRKKALALGYKMLLANWGTSEAIHLRYLSLFLMSTKRDASLFPKQVAEDTVVFLENDHGGKAKYKIESGTPVAVDILAPNHPFAQDLLGKSVGDEVVQPAAIGQPTKWKIAEIKHKYLDLLHIAMEQHSTLFPGSGALGQVRVETSGENAFQPVFEQARQRAKHVDDAAALYKQQLVPIDTIAAIIGADPIDASRGIRFRSGIRFDNCIGTADERGEALKAMEHPKAIIVDPVTLSIWQEIEILGVIANAQIEVQVVQATLDELGYRASEARRGVGQKGGSLEPSGDSFVLVEQTRYQSEALAVQCEALLIWAREHTVLVPTAPLKTEGGDEVRDFLARSSIDSIATSIESGVPLLVEDRRLRGLASAYGAIPSSWTQPLLMQLLNKGAFDRTAYVKAISALQRQKVGFVSVSSADLRTGAELGAEPAVFSSLVEAITGATVDRLGLVSIASEFILKLWKDDGFVDQRDRLVSEIFERLLVGPQAFILIRAIAVGVLTGIEAFGFPMSLLAMLWEKYFHRFIVGHFIAEPALWSKTS